MSLWTAEPQEKKCLPTFRSDTLSFPWHFRVSNFTK